MATPDAADGIHPAVFEPVPGPRPAGRSITCGNAAPEPAAPEASTIFNPCIAVDTGLVAAAFSGQRDGQKSRLQPAEARPWAARLGTAEDPKVVPIGFDHLSAQDF